MTPREYRLFTKCLETGLRRGYRRAFKRNDSPTVVQLLESLATNVAGEVLARSLDDLTPFLEMPA